MASKGDDRESVWLDLKIRDLDQDWVWVWVLPVLLCEGVGDVATASGAVVAMGVARNCNGCVCAAVICMESVEVACDVAGGGGGSGCCCCCCCGMGCGLAALSRTLLGLRLGGATLELLLPRCRLAVMHT